jgi:hypothetical protein
LIGDALAVIKSISDNAPKSLENGGFLGLYGLGMEPANRKAVRPAGVRLRRDQETFKI